MTRDAPPAVAVTPAFDDPRRRIPVMRPVLPKVPAVARWLDRCDATNWYANFGPVEQELRQRVADLLQVDASHVATAANATLALAGAVMVSSAKQWLAPSFTFAATASAVRFAQRGLRFGDVAAQTWWLDPAERREDEGLLPVAPFGTPIQTNWWPHDAQVVVDAAASLGTLLPTDVSHAPRTVLSDLPPDWAVVFSLHATKCVAAGEGAIAVFGDPDRAARFRAWTNFGFESTRVATLLGVNAKMSEMAAAYAHASLDEWPAASKEWLAARDSTNAIAFRHGLGSPPGQADAITPYWIATLASPQAVNRVESVLEAYGIGTRRWWHEGCHRMPAFEDVAHSGLQVSEDLAARSIGLPMYRGLTEDDAAHIDGALTEALSQASEQPATSTRRPAGVAGDGTALLVGP